MIICSGDDKYSFVSPNICDSYVQNFRECTSRGKDENSFLGIIVKDIVMTNEFTDGFLSKWIMKIGS